MKLTKIISFIWILIGIVFFVPAVAFGENDETFSNTDDIKQMMLDSLPDDFPEEMKESIKILPAQDGAETSKQNIIADVSINNGKIVEYNDKAVTVEFDIVNRMDIQPDIALGADFGQVDENGYLTVFSEVLDEGKYALNKDENFHHRITFPLPKYIDGVYQLLITAKNTRGVLLSQKNVGEIRISIQEDQLKVTKNTCKILITRDGQEHSITLGDFFTSQNWMGTLRQNDSAILECEVRNGNKKKTTVYSKLDIYRNFPFGDPVLSSKSKESAEINGKSSFTIRSLAFNANSPGKYFAKLTFIDQWGGISGDPVEIYYAVIGDSAIINQIRVDKNSLKKGEEAVAYATLMIFSEDRDRFPEIKISGQIYDKSGECGSAEVQGVEDGKTANIKLGFVARRDCNPLSVTIKTQDKNGNVLDSLSVDTFSQPPKKNIFTIRNILIVLTLIFTSSVVVGIVVRRRKNKRPNIPEKITGIILLVLIFGSLFGGKIGAAKAATYDMSSHCWSATHTVNGGVVAQDYGEIGNAELPPNWPLSFSHSMTFDLTCSPCGSNGCGANATIYLGGWPNKKFVMDPLGRTDSLTEVAGGTLAQSYSWGNLARGTANYSYGSSYAPFQWSSAGGHIWWDLISNCNSTILTNGGTCGMAPWRSTAETAPISVDMNLTYSSGRLFGSKYAAGKSPHDVTMNISISVPDPVNLDRWSRYIGGRPALQYSYDIDWRDGTTEQISLTNSTSVDVSHQYLNHTSLLVIRNPQVSVKVYSSSYSNEQLGEEIIASGPEIDIYPPGPDAACGADNGKLVFLPQIPTQLCSSGAPMEASMQWRWKCVNPWSSVDCGTQQIMDIGWRVYYDNETVRLPVYQPGQGSSPLQIAASGSNYSAVLLDPSAAGASKVRIQTPDGIKAPARFPKTLPGEEEDSGTGKCILDHSIIPCNLYEPGGTPISTAKKIFVSSKSYDGNLGGLAGADEKCQALADAAGFSGKFKAWLSNSNTAAASRLTHSTGPYIRIDGAMVADNWNDLVDGVLDNPILRDEYGVSYNDLVFTNTDGDGMVLSADPTLSCQDWTSNANPNRFVQGATTETDTRWTWNQAGKASPWYAWCDNNYRLYCIEQ